MSFPENPYVHMNLVTAPPPEVISQLSPANQAHWKGRENAVEVACDSCGASDVAKGEVIASDPITKARIYFTTHVTNSHDYTPQHMVDHGWSWD